MEMFSYYQDFFHDGSINAITCLDDEIIFEMESSQIFYCDNRDRLPLSSFQTIYGRLHAKGIISLKRNDQPVDSLTIEADRLDILDLKLSDNRIFFLAYWKDFQVQPSRSFGTFDFEVIAKEIYWENTANTTDPTLLGKYMGLEDDDDEEEEDSEVENDNSVSEESSTGAF